MKRPRPLSPSPSSLKYNSDSGISEVTIKLLLKRIKEREAICARDSSVDCKRNNSVDADGFDDVDDLSVLDNKPPGKETTRPIMMSSRTTTQKFVARVPIKTKTPILKIASLTVRPEVLTPMTVPPVSACMSLKNKKASVPKSSYLSSSPPPPPPPSSSSSTDDFTAMFIARGERMRKGRETESAKDTKERINGGGMTRGGDSSFASATAGLIKNLVLPKRGTSSKASHGEEIGDDEFDDMQRVPRCYLKPPANFVPIPPNGDITDSISGIGVKSKIPDYEYDVAFWCTSELTWKDMRDGKMEGEIAFGAFEQNKAMKAILIAALILPVLGDQQPNPSAGVEHANRDSKTKDNEETPGGAGGKRKEAGGGGGWRKSGQSSNVMFRVEEHAETRLYTPDDSLFALHATDGASSSSSSPLSSSPLPHVPVALSKRAGVTPPLATDATREATTSAFETADNKDVGSSSSRTDSGGKADVVDFATAFQAAHKSKSETEWRPGQSTKECPYPFDTIDEFMNLLDHARVITCWRSKQQYGLIRHVIPFEMRAQASRFRTFDLVSIVQEHTEYMPKNITLKDTLSRNGKQMKETYATNEMTASEAYQLGHLKTTADATIQLARAVAALFWHVTRITGFRLSYGYAPKHGGGETIYPRNISVRRYWDRVLFNANEHYAFTHVATPVPLLV